MSGDDAINRTLCEAFRSGCQGQINTKLTSLNEKIDTQNTALLTVSNKIDLLRVNEVSHLAIRLDTIDKEISVLKKLKRAPLGRKEWAQIIVAIIGSMTLIFLAFKGA